MKPKTPKEKSRAQISFELIFNLTWAISFWIMVSKTNHSACRGPAWFWSNYAKIFYILTTGVSSASLALFITKTSKTLSAAQSVALFTFDVVCFLIKLGGIPLGIGMAISVAYIDECTDLKGIVLAQFIVFAIAIGLVVVAACFSVLVVCIKKHGNIKGVMETFKKREHTVYSRFANVPNYTQLKYQVKYDEPSKNAASSASVSDQKSEKSVEIEIT